VRDPFTGMHFEILILPAIVIDWCGRVVQGI
jgi:hypothetical protein